MNAHEWNNITVYQFGDAVWFNDIVWYCLAKYIGPGNVGYREDFDPGPTPYDETFKEPDCGHLFWTTDKRKVMQ